MYEIIKEIQKKVKNIIIICGINDDEDLNIANEELEIYFDGKWFKATEQYDIKLDGYYQTCYIRSNKMKGKMSILQDYGDHEWACEDNRLEYPRGIFGISEMCSIGWYCGKIYAIYVVGDALVATPLAYFQHEIDITKLREKRPYNFKITVSNELNLNEKPRFDIYISSREKPEEDSIYGKWHNLNYIDDFTLRDMVMPQSFYRHANIILLESQKDSLK